MEPHYASGLGAGLMIRGERTTLVRSTLSVMSIHAMLSLELTDKTLEAFLGICRGSYEKVERMSRVPTV
jgi:hypothetical protein